MLLTLNKIINKLKEIQENHEQLNDFRFGNPADYGSEQDIKSFLLGAWLEPGSLLQRQVLTKLKLYVVGVVDLGDSGELPNIGMRNDVLSDAQLIILDVYAQLWEYFDENSIRLERTAPLQPEEDVWDESLWGWSLVIDINQFYSRDTCQVPTRELPVPPVDPYITRSPDLAVFPVEVQIAINEETELFFFQGEGFEPKTGNVTVTWDDPIEVWNGTAWLDYTNTISLPYTNGRLITESIYKIRLTSFSALALFRASAPGVSTEYNQVFSTI